MAGVRVLTSYSAYGGSFGSGAVLGSGARDKASATVNSFPGRWEPGAEVS